MDVAIGYLVIFFVSNILPQNQMSIFELVFPFEVVNLIYLDADVLHYNPFLDYRAANDATLFTSYNFICPFNPPHDVSYHLIVFLETQAAFLIILQPRVVEARFHVNFPNYFVRSDPRSLPIVF